MNKFEQFPRGEEENENLPEGQGRETEIKPEKGASLDNGEKLEELQKKENTEREK